MEYQTINPHFKFNYVFVYSIDLTMCLFLQKQKSQRKSCITILNVKVINTFKEYISNKLNKKKVFLFKSYLRSGFPDLEF